MIKDKMLELVGLLKQSLDQSWEKTANLDEEDRPDVFHKYMENKLSYMKDEGFIDNFTVNKKTIDDLKDLTVDD